MGISACIIVRDEPLLEQAVASVRPYVDEIVIVDTGSVDTSVAQRLADKFEIFTDCNDGDGYIADFSLARQRSFDLASHDTVLWLDADDEVVGLDKLPALTAVACRYIAPYEYTYSDSGDVIALQRRERIITNKSAFHWVRPVHEGLVARDGFTTQDSDLPVGIVWKHRRVPGKSKDLDRNLRILRAQRMREKAAGQEEPRTLYDLGVESHLRGLHLDASWCLSRYVTVSGWDAERFQACLRLVDLHAFYGHWSHATEVAQRAISICPEEASGYFAIAKLEHAQAGVCEGKAEKRHLKRALVYGSRGMGMPPSTALVSNPQDRAIAMPEMLADAAIRLNDKQTARKYVDMCLKARPNDPELLLRSATVGDTKPGSDKLDIVIMCARTGEDWNPAVIEASGMGGSETAVVQMGKRLAAAGHRVRVFCNTPTEGLFDGVEYRGHYGIRAVKSCDLLVAWRDATSLAYVPAKVKWLWVHDTGIANGTAWNLHLADRVLALSQWHARHLVENCGVGWEQVSVTSNGIDLERFEWPSRTGRVAHRALFTQSPDRGLEPLLKMWPAVKARVPDAELRVFYGWGAAESQPADTETGQWLIRVKALLEDMTPLGVTHHGRVDQDTLAEEMKSAGAWLYPSWAMQEGGYAFTDTSCIGSLEAQAAGMHLVVGKSGALSESVHNGLFCEPGNWDEFIDASVSALTNEDPDARGVTLQAAFECFSWDMVSNQWLDWVANDLLAGRHSTSYQDTSSQVLHMVLCPHISGEQAIDPYDTHAAAVTGGCKDGFLGLVKAMGKQGRYQVRAFATFKDRYAKINGVEYVRIDEFSGAPDPDACLAYYDTSPLAGLPNSVLRIGSHHTYTPYANFECTDVNLAPSNHSRETLRKQYDPTGEWQTLPNGVEIAVSRNPVPGRVIYHTSPDRGLHVLLAKWPEIRRRVPHATLHVTADVEKFAASAKDFIDIRQRECAEKVRDNLRLAQEAGGVTLLGRISREVLNTELSEASVFAFPCALMGPCETFSVSTMECMSIGLPVVMVPQDSLGGIYKDTAVLTDYDGFADAVCDTLESPDADRVERGKRLAAKHTFENQAKILTEILSQYLPANTKAPKFKANGAAQTHAG